MDLANIRKKLKEAKEKEKADAMKAAGEVAAEGLPHTGPQETETPQQPEPVSEQEATTTDASPELQSEGFTDLKPSGEEISETAGEEPARLAAEEPLHREIHEEILREFEPSPKPASAPRAAEEEMPQEAAVAEGVVELLAFKLAFEDYAFRVSDIEEIIKPQKITPVPRLGSHVLGISSLRGKIVPIIDLRKRLSITGEPEAKARPRIIILSGPKGSMGVWVDSVADVLRLPEGLLQEPPAHLSESEAKYIEATALWEGRFISVIKTGEALNLMREPQALPK